jgi:hypothetical protein
MKPPWNRIWFTLAALLLSIFLLAFTQNEPEILITLELTGGSHAGSYKLVPDYNGCQYGLGNPDSWEMNYSMYLNKPSGNSPDALALVMFSMPSMSQKETFTLTTAFGDYDTEAYSEYILDPANGKGTGEVTVEKKGKHAVLKVQGETPDGVGVNATIECLDVFDYTGATPDFNALDLSFPPDATAATGSLEFSLGEQSFQVTTAQEASCDQNVAEAGDLWYSYDPGGSYTDLNVFIQNLEAAKSGTSAFGFSLDDHPLYDYAASGGTLTVAQAGNTLTLEVDVHSPEGIPVHARVECSLTP